MSKKLFVCVLMAMIFIFALGACQAQTTPVESVPTIYAYDSVYDVTPTAVSTPLTFPTITPTVAPTPTVEPVDPPVTIDQLVLWYGDYFTATVRTYSSDNDTTHIRVYENDLVVEGLRFTGTDGWPIDITDEKFRPGDGQFIYMPWGYDSSQLCFVYSQPLATQKLIDPSMFEGQYVNVKVTRACGNNIVVVNDLYYVIVDDFVFDEVDQYRGGEFSGYWHWDAGWEIVSVSITPRLHDERIMSLHQALLDAVNWDNDWDVADGPIEACFDLQEHWVEVPGSSVYEIERLCGKMTWWQRYAVWGAIEIKDWEFIIALDSPGDFEYGIPSEWDGVVIEIEQNSCGDSEDMTSVDLTALTKGEIRNGSFCVPSGAYLAIAHKKYEPCWGGECVAPTYVTKTYYIP